MRLWRSLQGRLGLSIGLLMTVLWVATASVTASILYKEIQEVFDSALKETAQRVLPLAVVEIMGRDDYTISQRLATLNDQSEYFTYIVRDDQGRVLLQSHTADPQIIRADAPLGFSQNATHRLYTADALSGSLRITVAEPLAHRRAVASEIEVALGLPLLLVIPISLIAVMLAVRASMAPLRRFRDAMAQRHARDLSPVPTPGLPSEIVPMAGALNALLARLKAAFEAERSFAANAAHELRTPVAGAIAQAQRLQIESTDTAARHRAAEIESTLKRLTRLSERLMQLARAEGGRLRQDSATDLRAVVQLVIHDLSQGADAARLSLALPAAPFLSNLDPDAFGIVCRNLVENALRHSPPGSTVTVSLDDAGLFSVSNPGPVVPAETLARLQDRFERASALAQGSGLGLAIVAAIAEGVGSRLDLRSPRPGQSDGFVAAMLVPRNVA